MVTIIAGSRVLKDENLTSFMPEYRFPVTEVVCGCAEGIDQAGYRWAREHNIPVNFFPAWPHQYKWAVEHKTVHEVITYPAGGYRGWFKGYGFQRNLKMAEYSEAAIVVVHVVKKRRSNGASNMIDCAKSLGLAVTVKEVNE